MIIDYQKMWCPRAFCMNVTEQGWTFRKNRKLEIVDHGIFMVIEIQSNHFQVEKTDMVVQ